MRVRSKQSYRSILAQDIENYVASKRALGCRFDHEESGLRLLDRFLIQQRIRRLDQITRGSIERFLRSRPRRSPRSHNQLLGTVRRFFRRLTAHGRMPVMLALPIPRRSNGSRLPFIFDRYSAKRLLDASVALPDYWNARHRGPTYHAIFALLYGLGLRVGEVCNLQYGDIDFERQFLVIRCAKFGKSRLVPFGPRVAAALTGHVGRNGHVSRPSTPDAPVFTFNGRTPINRHSINRVFSVLIRALALPRPPGVPFPRTHDLRHSFAVGTLLRWYRSGINPTTRLLHLSTFMGHVSVSSTAVYLTVTAELLDVANCRFERYAIHAVKGAR